MTAQLPPISPVTPPSLEAYDSPIAPPAAGPVPALAGAAPASSVLENVRNVVAPREREVDKAVLEQDVRDAVAKMNDVAEALSANIRYRVHERSDMLQVQIVDINDNNRIIREVPSTEMLNVLARTHEVLGLIFDENA